LLILDLECRVEKCIHYSFELGSWKVNSKKLHCMLTWDVACSRA
jgi:hypothetical protein